MDIRRFADLLAVAARSSTLTLGGVDHEADLTAGDHLDCIRQRTRFWLATDGGLIANLAEDGIDSESEPGEIFCGSFGGSDREFQLTQALHDHEARRLVAIGERDEHGAG